LQKNVWNDRTGTILACFAGLKPKQIEIKENNIDAMTHYNLKEEGILLW
jgi:hypothetical protein